MCMVVMSVGDLELVCVLSPVVAADLVIGVAESVMGGYFFGSSAYLCGIS